MRFTWDIPWKTHMIPILFLFVMTLSQTVFNSADITMLGLMKGNYAVGIYSTSVKIYTLVATLLGSVVAVTVPRLSMLMGKNKMKEYTNVFSQVINLLSLFVIPGTIGLMMLSKEIVIIIAGEKYLPSVNSLRILGLAIIFSNFSFIFTNCALIPAKRENLALKNTIITAILNILLNFILIPVLSYDGTSLSTVIAEFMTMIMNYKSSRDIIKNIIFSDNVKNNIIASLVGSLGIIFICLLCKVAYTTLLLRTILSIIFSIIIYSCILIILKNNIAIYYLNMIKNKLTKRI